MAVMVMGEEPDPLVGKQVGPCKIEGVLGRGGMGIVYRAHHVPLDRPVALKVLKPSLRLGPVEIARFLAEARAAAKLDDPRIVSIYDVGDQGGILYIIMQLVEGETLDEKIVRSGPIGQREALVVMKEILLGVSVAHKKGIVHRDLKPSNIMIGPSGTVKIMDFGIAGATAPDSDGLLEEAPAAGSFEFMAPEQAFTSKPDSRMDLYSFGAIYFFVLTGMPPFRGEPMEVLVKVREDPAPDVREINREVTAAAARLISRLMEKFPDMRPGSAEEVLKAMSASDMLLDVDPSGSPFKILPPPVVPKVGFVPPVRPGAEAAVAAPEAPQVPPPPPPLPELEGAGGWPSRLIMAALFVLIFGRHWLRVAPADWAAGGFAMAAVAEVLLYRRAVASLRLAAGPLLYLALLFCFYRFGLGPAWGSPPVPSLETGVVAALGLALGGAALYLGFLQSAAEDRALAAVLLFLSACLVFVSAASLGLGESESWAPALAALLRRQWASWTLSGGPWRWGGLAVVYAGFQIARFSSLAPVEEGPAKKVLRWGL